MASPEPRRGFFRCGVGPFKAMLRWVEWGPPDGPVVVCVHGLTRNGRDFDALAARLAARGRRVICPDVFGRGESDWLPDGKLYAVPAYALAFQAFLRALPGPVDWVGTSMGGLIGLALGAMPGVAPRRMVLNDVGPFLPAAALRRIGAYLGVRHDFATVEEVETHLRLVHAGFGALPDAAWRHMAATSARRTAAGRLAMHYDPAIGTAFRVGPVVDVDLWPLWRALRQPVLVIRGEESDLLEASTAATMAERPGTRVVTFPRCGHAPALIDPAQTDAVLGFLSEGGAATGPEG